MAAFCVLEFSSIATKFSDAERKRFRSLLEMARGSSFEGERDNALEAAKRLAKKHGLSLEEAARIESAEHQVPEQEPMQPPARPQRAPDVFYGYQNHSVDSIREAKRQRDEAMAEARARGLDREEEAAQAKKAAREFTRKTNSKSRRNPVSHANVLLKETALPFSEIASITGLDLYVIVALKLKQRDAAFSV